MKKTSAAFFIAFFLFFASCNKQVVKQNVNTTTDPNLKSDATGITLSEATTLAQHFLQSKNKNGSVTISNTQTIIKDGVPYFHVINANKGFVILSSDSMYAPILAYDSIENFSLAKENINPGLVNWFNKHAQELDFVRNHKSAAIDSIAKNNKILWCVLGSQVAINTRVIAPSPNGNFGSMPVAVLSSAPFATQSNSTIGPLCRTLWGQDYPFNYYCDMKTGGPTMFGGRAPAGCVPVAMAQVMYFWKYPAKYNWAIMPLTKQAYNFVPINDCSQLIYDIGKKAGTNYTASESDTKVVDIPTAFNALGYSSATNTESPGQQKWSGGDDGTTYAGLLTNEIQSYQRPCMVSGFSDYHSVFGLGILPTPANSEGHTWVCDGSNVTTYIYGTTYTYLLGNGQIVNADVVTSTQAVSLLHMNWGWENPNVVGQNEQAGFLLTNNGWYNCNINYTQSGVASDDFQYFQVITYNIHP